MTLAPELLFAALVELRDHADEVSLVAARELESAQVIADWTLLWQDLQVLVEQHAPSSTDALALLGAMFPTVGGAS